MKIPIIHSIISKYRHRKSENKKQQYVNQLESKIKKMKDQSKHGKRSDKFSKDYALKTEHLLQIYKIKLKMVHLTVTDGLNIYQNKTKIAWFDCDINGYRGELFFSHHHISKPTQKALETVFGKGVH